MTFIRWAVAVIAASILLLVPHAFVQAGSGLTTLNWANSYKTLSTSSYANSNMTGLWQAILNSNDAGLGIDGNFGTLTRNATIDWQNDMGVPATGVVNFATWNATFYAPDGVYAPLRLSTTGYVDGYGTIHYSYYGGGAACTAALGWNSFASQWLFSQRPSQPWALVHASTADTISSVAACG